MRSSIDPVGTRTGRRILFSVLYLCEGAPIGFLWWTLPAELRASGVPIDRITALTAVTTLPWVFKFAWAPLVDVLRSRGLELRHWIVLSQALMGFALLPLVGIDDLAVHYELVYALLLAHSVAAATQDVAIDAWAIRVTPREELGSLNGSMQVGMFLGRWLFGAGLLLTGDALAGGAAVGALIALVWATGILVLISRDADDGPAQAESLAFARSLRAAFGRRATWLALGIALISGAGFEGLGALAGPLLVDRGFGAERIGAFYSLNVVAMIAGSLAGGLLTDRLGRKSAVTVLLVAIALEVGAVAALDRAALGYAFVFAAMVAVYFAYGMFIAATYALFMDLTDRSLAATQFSAYMGATNACEAWSGWTAGQFAARHGYPAALGALAAASLLALPLLRALRERPKNCDDARSDRDDS
jgi:MFS family permease